MNLDAADPDAQDVLSEAAELSVTLFKALEVKVLLETEIDKRGLSTAGR